MTTQSRQPRVKANVHIRWILRRDMLEILGIESKSFEYPWTEDDFLRHLRHRNCIGMVAEMLGKTVCYTLYELGRDYLRLANFAVHPHYRRLGIGGQMLSRLKGKVVSHRRTRIDMLVSERNLTGLLFLRNQGFVAAQLLRDYYEDLGDDAVEMVYEVS